MGQPILCTQCGATTSPRRVTPGSGWITFVLLVCFIAPGLIYWIWRHTSTYLVCAQCGSKSVIPPSTPVAQDMIATRPLVAASVAQEEQRRKDIRVGTVTAVGIVVLVIVLSKITSCAGH